MVDVVIGKNEKIIQKVAEKYARQGYHVEIHVDAQATLGEVIPSVYLLDIVAQNEYEKVVVEVSSRKKMDAYPGYLSALAKVIDAKPGWVLELIMLNDSPAPEMIEVMLPVLTRDQVAEKLNIADDLLQADKLQPAFMQAWDAAAGLMRAVILEQNDDINVELPMPLYGAVEASVSIGLIDQPDGLKYYEKAAEIHDALIKNTLPADFDLAGYTAQFIEKVRTLLHESTLTN